MSEESEESRKDRIDRELMELLNGLRVALPGVQVLFAFLLTVPFAQGFAQVTDFQRAAYLICLLCAAVSTGFFIAPAAQHRILFRAHEKETLLRRSNNYAVIASIVLVLAIASAVLLVVDYLFTRAQAWTSAGAVMALLLWLWELQPTLHRSRSSQSRRTEE